MRVGPVLAASVLRPTNEDGGLSSFISPGVRPGRPWYDRQRDCSPLQLQPTLKDETVSRLILPTGRDRMKRKNLGETISEIPERSSWQRSKISTYSLVPHCSERLTWF